ncbi:MAG: family 43 glycosylhydrolase [Ignavibacteriaceae bacterium]
MKKNILFAIIMNFCTINAQNPIVPAGNYCADPSAHVWPDGKIYVYGSKDESQKYYCSKSYDVWCSSDLVHWVKTENAFSTKDINDQAKFKNDFLYAPDCMYKNGTYYLYYCLSSAKDNEGVAISKSPTGPFVNGKVINLKGMDQIDPCVFMDDDGQAYMIWGQFAAKVAKLKPDMTEIDPSTIKDSVVTEKEHYFHEGGYMIKRNGIYYFIYADMQRANMPTCIGYSTSKSPFGPFKYGGIIVDNNHCDPGVWNNHGSVVEMNGKWYVFYHRSTHDSFSMRKTCIEPITFNSDGSIKEVEMTSQGAGRPLDSFTEIEADRACLLFGNVRIQNYTKDNDELGGIKNGDRAAFKYLDYGSGADGFEVSVIPGKNAGKIDIVTDQPWHAAVGSIEIPAGDSKTIKTFNCTINKIKGVHALWLRFSGDGENLFAVDSFKFLR